LPKMTDEQIDAFLREARVSMLATVQPDGVPHVTPVWHHYDGEKLYVCSDADSVKARNLRGNSNVTLLVATVSPPHQYVMVQGTAELSRDKISELVWAMSIAYKGEEEGRVYAEQAIRDFDFVTITIEPTNIVSLYIGS
jgi:PPOX class probable F420-dependent enzyme